MKILMKQVRDLKALLKDLERCVKNPKLLREGRNFTNFKMRPREALANWILCVTAQYATKKNLTFGEDPSTGDGAIIDKETANVILLTEHVLVPYSIGGDVNQAIIDAIDSKSKKGEEYSKNRCLLVFSEKKGMVHPSDIRRHIHKKTKFKTIYLIALENSEGDGYVYWLTPLITTSNILTVHKVFIEPNFDNWRVELFEGIQNSYGFN